MKKAICLIFTLCFLLSAFSVVSFAETSAATTFDFSVPETPKFVAEVTAEALKNFYAEDYTSLLATNQNEVTTGTVTVNNMSVENCTISVRSFRVSDFAFSDPENAEEEAQTFLNDLLPQIESAIHGTYLSTVLAGISAKYEIKTEGETQTLLIHIALASRQTLSDYNSTLSSVRSIASSWKSLNLGESITALSNYLTDSGFRLGAAQYSTAAFLQNKVGNSQDFAGLVSLLLTELGHRNVILSGYRTRDNVSVSWVLLESQDRWYHYDYVSSTVYDTAGQPLLTDRSYWLLSTATIQSSHVFQEEKFASYLSAATVDYNFSTADVTPPDTTQDKSALKLLIDDVNDLVKYSSKRYTEDSYQNFTNELNAAIQVYEKKNATAEEIQVALISLRNAFNGLVLLDVPDKSALESLVNENVDLSLYTDESAYAYLQALNEARRVYGSDDISAEDVSNAVQALTKAREGLMYRADKNVLRQYIETLDAMLNDPQYNEIQKNALAALRADLQEICDNDSASTDQITAGVAQYESVMERLASMAPGTSSQPTTDPSANSDTSITQAPKKQVNIKTVLIIIASVFSALAIISILLYVFFPQIREKILQIRGKKSSANRKAVSVVDEPTIQLSVADAADLDDLTMDGTQIFTAISDPTNDDK